MPDCRPFTSERLREGRVTVLVGEHDAKFRSLWGAAAEVVRGAHHDVVHDCPEEVAKAAEALRLRILPD